MGTARWREHALSRLQRLHPTWEFSGATWLPYIWINTGSSEVATGVYQTALECGCPVRHAAHGYDLPGNVRIAVRRPYDFSVLYQALLKYEYSRRRYSGQTAFGTFADVQPSVVDGV